MYYLIGVLLLCIILTIRVATKRRQEELRARKALTRMQALDTVHLWKVYSSCKTHAQRRVYFEWEERLWNQLNK